MISRRFSIFSLSKVGEIERRQRIGRGRELGTSCNWRQQCLDPSLKFLLVKVIRIYRALLIVVCRASIPPCFFVRAFIMPYLANERTRRELREIIERRRDELSDSNHRVHDLFSYTHRCKKFTFESILKRIVSFLKKEKKEKNLIPLIPRIIDTTQPTCTTRKSGLW